MVKNSPRKLQLVYLKLCNYYFLVLCRVRVSNLQHLTQGVLIVAIWNTTPLGHTGKL